MKRKEKETKNKPPKKEVEEEIVEGKEVAMVEGVQSQRPKEKSNIVSNKREVIVEVIEEGALTLKEEVVDKEEATILPI